MLNKLTAAAIGIPVIAGPAEATAIGNILGQLVASGNVENWEQARAVARQSFSTESY